MNWQDILTILLPLLVLMSWVYNRIEKKSDERQKQIEKRADERQKEIEKRFDDLKTEISGLRSATQSLDSRVSRIEGHLTGMHYHWEPKVIEKKNDK